jgi:hypothetical protein
MLKLAPDERRVYKHICTLVDNEEVYTHEQIGNFEYLETFANSGAEK